MNRGVTISFDPNLYSKKNEQDLYREYETLSNELFQSYHDPRTYACRNRSEYSEKSVALKKKYRRVIESREEQMFRESIMEDAEQIYHERGSAIADKSGYDVSSKTQWIPSEFLVSHDGKSVEILSYINNLHPIKYKKLYLVISQIFCKFIPLFEKTSTDVIYPIRNCNRVIEFDPHGWYTTQFKNWDKYAKKNERELGALPHELSGT